HGVAVERVLAPTAYEETGHRRADPALAEWTAGRAFRFSIFPLDAHRTKSGYLAYHQELTAEPDLLDLRRTAAVAPLDVSLCAEAQRVDADGLYLHRDTGGWHAHGTNARLDATISVTRDTVDETALTTWSAEDNRWYTSAPVHTGGAAAEVPA